MFENNLIWVVLVSLVGLWIIIDFIRSMYDGIKGENQHPSLDQEDSGF